MGSKSLSDFQIDAKCGPKSPQEFRFAKALFANHSEADDELELKRGDVLTVLTQNPKGLKGWWLCVNHSDGRTGIVAANRLRLIPLPSADLFPLGAQSCCTLSDVIDGHKPVDDTRRKSWNAFSIEKKSALRDLSTEYDIPIRFGSTTGVHLYDSPQKLDDLYDIPKQRLVLSSDSSDETPVRDSSPDDTVRQRLSAENLTSMASEDEERSLYCSPKTCCDLYDIPVNNRSVRETSDDLKSVGDYDWPKSKLLLMNECIETLTQSESICCQTLQQLFQNFCVGTDWRSRDCLRTDIRVVELCQTCHSLGRHLRQFVTLCERCVFSARSHCQDAKMVFKLDQLVQQLSTSLSIVENALQVMDDNRVWTLERIHRPRDARAQHDHCDRLMACAKGLSEDIKHLKAFIEGNVKWIFGDQNGNKVYAKPPIAPKPHALQSMAQTRPLPAVPVAENWEDRDYDELAQHDYVCLESKQMIEKQMKTTKDESKRESTDGSLVEYYRREASECARLLTQSVNEMVATINRNHLQVPKVALLNESKFVVICAQKLVFVCDHFGAKSTRTTACIKDLSESVRAFVATVRKCSLTGRSFPTNESVEDVFESLISVSLLSNQLVESLH